MVTLPTIESYSDSDLSKATAFSTALNRYLQQRGSIPDHLKLRTQRWSECALATYFQSVSARDVCLSWSSATDLILKSIWSKYDLHKTQIHLVALGKLGASELNLSSDIDILFLSNSPVKSDETKKLRGFLKELSQVTEHGFLYRVDLDLKPGGPRSPLVTSVDHYRHHLSYFSEPWERMALIRLRKVLGNNKLSDFYQDLKRFTFRKHIDYTLFGNFSSLRDQLHSKHYKAGKNNLKFSPGGIRELELFINTLQVIHGGRRTKLQTRSTEEALKTLAAEEIISNDDSQCLIDIYWKYRYLENLIQMRGDQHTYTLPDNLDFTNYSHLKNDFHNSCEKVTSLYEEFLRPFTVKKGIRNKALDRALSNEPQNLWTELKGKYNTSTLSAGHKREQLLFFDNCLNFIKDFEETAQLASISHLDKFLQQTHSRHSILQIFNQHLGFLDETLWLFAHSPRLSNILINRPDLTDSFLTKTYDLDTSNEEDFYSSLRDYRLLSELISSSAFLKNKDISKLNENLSLATDIVCTQLLEFLKKKFPNSNLDILSLGKWATKEMGLLSDLDFVFIFDEKNSENIKMARRFINFIQSPQYGQSIYEIDLRLRPSGNAGPLVTAKKDLVTYLNFKAEPWERQAYITSRSISTSKRIKFQPKPLSDSDIDSLFKIRKQLLRLNSTNILDLKFGYGGLVHTEFVAQTALLKKGVFPDQVNLSGLLSPFIKQENLAKITLIHNNYKNLRTYQQLMILISNYSSSSLKRSSEVYKKLSKICKKSETELFHEISELQATQESLLDEFEKDLSLA